MKESSKSDVIQQASHLPIGVIAGATYPFRALKLLSQTPQLWVCVIIPILLNLVIGAVLFVGLLNPGWQAVNSWTASLPDQIAEWIVGLPGWLARWLSWLPAWASFFDDVLRWILAIALLILTGLLLVQFGAILGAPWYGSLAEQIEKLRLGQLPPGAPGLTRALEDIRRAILFQLKKLLLAVVLGVPLLLLNLIPLPGISSTISSIGGVALASLLVGLDFLDPPLERRRLSFRRKLGIFGRSLPASATFSWVCLVMISIPLLNLLVVPICVAGGTLFCCDRILPYLAQNNPEISQPS